MGKAAGGGEGKGNAGRDKGQNTELAKWNRNSLTEDTPRDAVINALRLHLHNFAYKTFKIKNQRSLKLGLSDYAIRLLQFAVACCITALQFQFQPQPPPPIYFEINTTDTRGCLCNLF
jgi:hypothetical protein